MAGRGLGEQLDRRCREAVDAVAARLEDLGAVRLSDISTGWPGMSDGWSLRIILDGELIGLNLLLPIDFPWKAPKIFLASAPPFPSVPHVESDGSLCVLPSGSEWDTTDPVGLVEAVIVDAVEVLSAGRDGTNQEDFLSEVQSYWMPIVGLPEIRSLLKPEAASRPVRVWKGKSFYLVAEDDLCIDEWLRHRFPGGKKRRPHRGALLCWLQQAPLPTEFPSTPDEVVALVERAGLAEELARVIASDARGALVVLGFPAAAGASFLAVEIIPGALKSQDNRFSVEERLARGFRRDRMPVQILVDRFLVRSQVRNRRVQRIDPDWVHGRDANLDLSELRASTVAIVGCGSLGSLVAKQLAASGVGAFVLVDPEVMEAANTGRHALGSASIGQSKAAELARLLEGDFPHLFDCKVAVDRWQAAVRAKARILRDVDLVISTIGSWTSEGMLDTCLAGQKSKVVYGWMEPHAAAAHAVFLDHEAGGPCFHCGMTRKGVPRFSVTRWPGRTILREPACGAMFQPYGAVHLTKAATLVAEVALDALLYQIEGGAHRVCSVSQRALNTFGGTWSEDWLAAVDGAPGGREIERGWPLTEGCPGCQ